MFTKNEYIQYFQMLLDKEQGMVFALERLIPSVSDATILSSLKEILLEELEHSRMVRDLIDRVISPPSEARSQSRTQLLGTARLVPCVGGAVLSASTLDYSLGGVCVELEQTLKVGERFSVTMHFYESQKSIEKNATVCWCRQVGARRYRAGFAFEEE